MELLEEGACLEGRFPSPNGHRCNWPESPQGLQARLLNETHPPTGTGRDTVISSSGFRCNRIYSSQGVSEYFLRNGLGEGDSCCLKNVKRKPRVWRAKACRPC